MIRIITFLIFNDGFFMRTRTVTAVAGMAHQPFYIDQLSTIIFKENGRSAIIILSGGAFAFLSPFEGEPVALTFLQKGFHTFVLEYTVSDNCRYPDVLIEVSAAIKLVRDKAKEWHTDAGHISLMGFKEVL